MKRWPLFLIAAPAAVAVWSGWVGLGGMCGFGLVQPFPGIVSWHLDTAITLPVGVEAYGAYALGAWLTPETPDKARTFARRSAIGALTLGMLGQVVYHLLAAAHATRAPWPVVVLVACLPVVTLGFGAALTHLLRDAPESAPQPAPDAAPASASQAAPADAPKPVARRAPKRAKAAAPETDPELHFAAALSAGELPSIRRIRRELHLGQPKAQQVHAQLAAAMTGTVPAEN
jgi:hypothetical protein